MAKRPPEIYNPGELERVRNNLGRISPEEAKRVASLLGGEIGVERNERPTPHKRHTAPIAEKTREHTRTGAHRETRGRQDLSANQPHGTSALEPQQHTARRTIGRNVTSFIETVKKNFLAARKEYGLKTYAGSIASLLSFILPVPDYVHPTFVLGSRKLITESVEEFVLLARRLVRSNDEAFMKALAVNPFYLKVLQTICTWDIATVHRELSRFRLGPERLRFSECREFTIALYRPYLILHRLAPERHIGAALEYALGCALTTSQPDAHPALKKLVSDMLALVPTVFGTVRKRCYPFLLKLTPGRCIEYEAYFASVPDTVDEVFSLPPGAYLQPEEAEAARNREADRADSRAAAGEAQTQPETEPAADTTEFIPADDADEASDTMPAEPETPVPEAGAAESIDGDPDDRPLDGTPSTARSEPAAADTIPPRARAGMQNLDRIFPEHGLAAMERFPDLYPLLSSEFEPPMGAEYVPPEDPLLQIIFLHSILNELFYGFRSIEFGALSGTGELSGMIEDLIEPVFESWSFFRTEFFDKQYFPRLIDLQRQTERNADFPHTDYGHKLQADLKWLRRLYLLPYQETERVAGIGRTVRLSDAPVLYESLTTLKNVFAEMSGEIESALNRLKADESENQAGIVCATLGNPWDAYHFEIENPVSARLSRLLFRRVKTPDGLVKVKDNRNNAHLVAFTASIVILFEHLINCRTSYFYTARPSRLVRLGSRTASTDSQ